MPSYPADIFTNFATSTIRGGAGGAGTPLNPTDTTLLLATGDGAKFPQPAAGTPSGTTFRLLIGTTDIAQVTGRSGDSLTIVRANNLASTDPDHNASTPPTWPVGTTVQLAYTAANGTDPWTALNSGRVYFLADYGAKGDGATDDTTAMQAATEAARIAGGGTIMGTTGATYLVHLTVNPNVAGVSAALHLGTNCTLDLNGATILLKTNSAVDQQRLISNWNPQSSGTDHTIRIRNGTVNGNAANQSGVVGLTQCDGIWLNYARDIQVSNMICKNNYGSTNTSPGEGRQLLCRNCADVVYLNCSAYMDDGSNKTSAGIAMYNCYNCQFTNCTVHDMTFSYGFTAFESSMVEFTNCSAYNCAAGPGFQIEVCEYVTVTACQSGGATLSYGAAGPIAASTNLGVKFGFEVFGTIHAQLVDCTALNASVDGFSFSDAVTPAVVQNDITCIGCSAGASTSHGFATAGAGYDYSFIGCTAFSNTSRGFLIQNSGSSGQDKFIGCRAVGNGTGFQIDATPLPFSTMIGCEALSNTTQGTFGGVNSTTIVGKLTAPAVPGTTSALTNPFPFATTVYVLGGTVTHVTVDGTDVATATSATLPVTVRLPAGKTITLTYTVAPSWQWYAD